MKKAILGVVGAVVLSLGVPGLGTSAFGVPGGGSGCGQHCQAVKVCKDNYRTSRAQAQSYYRALIAGGVSRQDAKTEARVAFDDAKANLRACLNAA